MNNTVCATKSNDVLHDFQKIVQITGFVQRLEHYIDIRKFESILPDVPALRSSCICSGHS